MENSTIDIQAFLRQHIKTMTPYSSARDEFEDVSTTNIFLDANENPYGTALGEPYNRYPDPYQRAVKQKISVLKDIPTKNIFLGNGSDEPIDLLYRAFVEPKEDNVIILPPTYGMYKVSAELNNVTCKEVALTTDLDLDVDGILAAVDNNTKIIFVCSPNNPTGNAVSTDRIIALIEQFNGIVVVDEAYIDFSAQPSFIQKIEKYPNLIVLQTFSKAWGMAGLRLGMMFANAEIVRVFNVIKPPYNINQLTQEKALEALDNVDKVRDMVAKMLSERNRLVEEFKEMPLVKNIFPSDANFILIQVDNADANYQTLVDQGIIIRNRSKVLLCEQGLRISIGTKEENDVLLEKMKQL
ncbi:histidinol-phosphate transaminase [Flammeovirga kamogawensis]|uniref:Histidinol-phosphate aminotransferase n=1 Tax=Flammeovirga kamogawensis TaxID=373891 RepID=A0ABX8GZ68_9BACT|nr:histidinol-phosphate transaminase [Flammeovirga kamogawensis]MBB6458997.1 histidinol-phosphate aminotransferase [Flammeovirga kamogawensis]QWG08571.1 histidinol-phosphate transaminase [Flammeovirga kamogawensis]TRX66863.1 histidinol-phosphate transaminase [Flammeovirga kamogawensis]